LTKPAVADVVVIADVLNDTAKSLKPSPSKSPLTMPWGVQVTGIPLTCAGQLTLKRGKVSKNPVPRSVPSGDLVVRFNRNETEISAVVAVPLFNTAAAPLFNTAMSCTLSASISPWKFATVKAVAATPTG
jgi:hypothetical protein